MAFGSLFGGKNVARDGAADGTQEVLALGQRLCPLAGSEQCQRGAADVAQAGILNPEVAQALVGLAETGLAQAHDQVAHHLARLRGNGAVRDAVDIFQPHVLGIGQ